MVKRKAPPGRAVVHRRVGLEAQVGEQQHRVVDAADEGRVGEVRERGEDEGGVVPLEGLGQEQVEPHLVPPHVERVVLLVHDEPGIDGRVGVAERVVEVLGAEREGVQVVVLPGPGRAHRDLGREAGLVGLVGAGAGRCGLPVGRDEHVPLGQPVGRALPQRGVAVEVELPQRPGGLEPEAGQRTGAGHDLAGDLERPQHHLGPQRPAHLAHLVHHLVPAEEQDAVEVPARLLPGGVELQHPLPLPLVEDRERGARAEMQEVGGVPEAGHAPGHLLLADGDEDGTLDVEADPGLIEDHLRGEDLPVHRLLRGLRDERVHLGATEHEGAHPVVGANVHVEVEEVGRGEDPLRGRESLAPLGIEAEVEHPADLEGIGGRGGRGEALGLGAGGLELRVGGGAGVAGAGCGWGFASAGLPKMSSSLGRSCASAGAAASARSRARAVRGVIDSSIRARPW